jgi:hypothetical protein
MINARFVLLCLILLNACKSSHGSAVKVDNGVEAIDGQMPAVVRLTVGGGGLCTGTFLNDSVVLTAGHCIVGGDKNSVSVFGTASVDIIVSEKFGEIMKKAQEASFQGEAEKLFVRYDQALVIFPPGTAANGGVTSFKKIEKSGNLNGRKVFLAGFGLGNIEDASSSGVKRWGMNTIDTEEDGIVYVTGGTSAVPGQDSNAAKGDSGGPLLLDVPGGENQKIVGTLSTGPWVRAVAQSKYASTRSSYSRALYKYAIEQRGVAPFEY